MQTIARLVIVQTNPENTDNPVVDVYDIHTNKWIFRDTKLEAINRLHSENYIPLGETVYWTNPDSDLYRFGKLEAEFGGKLVVRDAETNDLIHLSRESVYWDRLGAVREIISRQESKPNNVVKLLVKPENKPGEQMALFGT